MLPRNFRVAIGEIEAPSRNRARAFSAILFSVRRWLFCGFVICAGFSWMAPPRGISSRALERRRQSEQQNSQPQQAQPRQAAPQQGTPQQKNPQQPAAATPAAPAQQGGENPTAPPQAPMHIGPVVVIDPGHGGTDTGARGASGLVEKDLALQMARILGSELERLGYRVVMTRNDDSNPSYDDRAAVANAFRDAIFINLHVSSSGATGSTRAYFYEFPSSAPDMISATSAGATTNAAANTAPVSLKSGIPWFEAQRPFADQSRRLANLVQIELTHRFSQSPNAPSPAAVRNLRSVAGSAVAVEISSVSVSDPIALTSLTGPLAAAIAKGVAAFRPIIVVPPELPPTAQPPTAQPQSPETQPSSSQPPTGQP